MKDGTVLAEYPPVVQREQIAKESTITEMRRILTEVVSEGLGKRRVPINFRLQVKQELHKCRKELQDIKQV